MYPTVVGRNAYRRRFLPDIKRNSKKWLGNNKTMAMLGHLLRGPGRSIMRTKQEKRCFYIKSNMESPVAFCKCSFDPCPVRPIKDIYDISHAERKLKHINNSINIPNHDCDIYAANYPCFDCASIFTTKYYLSKHKCKIRGIKFTLNKVKTYGYTCSFIKNLAKTLTTSKNVNIIDGQKSTSLINVFHNFDDIDSVILNDANTSFTNTTELFKFIKNILCFFLKVKQKCSKGKKTSLYVLINHVLKLSKILSKNVYFLIDFNVPWTAIKQFEKISKLSNNLVFVAKTISIEPWKFATNGLTINFLTTSVYKDELHELIDESPMNKYDQKYFLDLVRHDSPILDDVSFLFNSKEVLALSQSQLKITGGYKNILYIRSLQYCIINRLELLSLSTESLLLLFIITKYCGGDSFFLSDLKSYFYTIERRLRQKKFWFKGKNKNEINNILNFNQKITKEISGYLNEMVSLGLYYHIFTNDGQKTNEKFILRRENKNYKLSETVKMFIVNVYNNNNILQAAVRHI